MVVEPRNALLTYATTRSANDTPFRLVAEHPCEPGVIVTLDGTVHQQFEVRSDQSGGTHVRFHLNPRDVSGTDTNGVTYDAHGAANNTLLIKPGSANTETFVSVFNVRARQSESDFVVHENTHITLNANGEPTAVVENTKVICN
jgi:hypothetical protein